VDDVVGLEIETLGVHRLAGRATTDLRAGLAQVPARRAVDGAADPAAGAQLRVGRVHDGLDGDIRDFPAGYDTLVGERGITLSGGQRQRTAIARALLRRAPILLLDDCLSSVDTHTEDEILKGLRGEMSGRTTLIVSHRVSTVRHADRIVVLEAGRIIESGVHDELLGMDGAYADLYRKQQLEDELEAS
jgi:ATP-binding cassette subfamily B protein